MEIDLGKVLGITGGLVQVLAYYLYWRNLRGDVVKLKPSTWVLWTFLGWLAFVSYLAVNNDPFASAAFLANGVCSAVITVYAFIYGKSEKLDTSDKLCIGAGAATIIAWVFVNATAANIVLLGTALCSVIPTYVRVFRNPGKERATPWLVWTVAETLFTLAVIAHYEGSWLAVAVSGLRVLANLSIGLLALRRAPVKDLVEEAKQRWREELPQRVEKMKAMLSPEAPADVPTPTVATDD